MGKRVGMVAAVLAAATVLLVSGPAAYALAAPTVPATIVVPGGNVPFLVAHARGAQIYKCQPSSQAYAWTLTAPAAVLKNGSNQLLSSTLGS